MNFDELEISVSKHFRNTQLRKWDWDIHDLRTALKEAHKIEKIGKYKYEAYTKYRSSGKTKKLIFVVYEFDKILYLITGVEGK